MTDPTPEELDALQRELRLAAVSRIGVCRRAEAAITALRAALAEARLERDVNKRIAVEHIEAEIEQACETDALIAAAYQAAAGEAKDQERACAEWYQQTGKHAVLYDQFDVIANRILALAKPGARTLLDQRIEEAERAGYERGTREAINSIAFNDHVSNDRLARLLPEFTKFFRGAASDEQIVEHYAICKEAAARRGISI